MKRNSQRPLRVTTLSRTTQTRRNVSENEIVACNSGSDSLEFGLFEAEDVRRRFFHGLNHACCAEGAAEMLGGSVSLVVIAHLGNGASVSAVRDGPATVSIRPRSTGGLGSATEILHE